MVRTYAKVKKRERKRILKDRVSKSSGDIGASLGRPRSTISHVVRKASEDSEDFRKMERQVVVDMVTNIVHDLLQHGKKSWVSANDVKKKFPGNIALRTLQLIMEENGLSRLKRERPAWSKMDTSFRPSLASQQSYVMSQGHW
jgi:hypothetical protein